MEIHKYGIVYPNSQYKSGWCFLYGHACTTKSEMDQYCQTLDPDGKTMRVVELPFDLDNPNPSIGNPIDKPIGNKPVNKLTDISPETAAIMLELWDDLIKKRV
jgi:hypothetical protein